MKLSPLSSSILAAAVLCVLPGLALFDVIQAQQPATPQSTSKRQAPKASETPAAATTKAATSKDAVEEAQQHRKVSSEPGNHSTIRTLINLARHLRSKLFRRERRPPANVGTVRSLTTSALRDSEQYGPAADISHAVQPQWRQYRSSSLSSSLRKRVSLRRPRRPSHRSARVV